MSTYFPILLAHFSRTLRENFESSSPKCGVPPFGHSTQLRVFVDPDLLQYDEVWAAAGTWNDVFPIAPDDLFRASGAVVADLKRS